MRHRIQGVHSDGCGTLLHYPDAVVIGSLGHCGGAAARRHKRMQMMLTDTTVGAKVDGLLYNTDNSLERYKATDSPKYQ